MRKSIVQLLKIANYICLGLESNDFQLFQDGEISFVDIPITRQISKNLLKIIPNNFFIYPKKNGKCILRVFGMTEKKIGAPCRTTGMDCDSNC